MPLQYRGVDYSWGRPDLNCLYSKGARFAMRYGSRDPSKNLSKPELDAILAAGMSCGVFWQEGKTQMTRGYSGGQTDARDAKALFDGMGLAGIPVYFACDYDPPSGDWPAIDAYLDGAASVIGRNRTGGYGGKAFISREFGSGKILWGAQTYAWSGSPTQWDSRAQLRQVDNDVTVCGAAIDWEEAWAADHGQWPRPSAPSAPGASQPARTGEYAVALPPGAQAVGVSFNGAPWTSVGFCGDDTVFDQVITIRCAWHTGGTGAGWTVQTAYVDRSHNKVTIGIPAGCDGASFSRLDTAPCVIYPSFS